MGIDAVHIIISAANYALELFTTMLEAAGLSDFYFAMLAILLIVTFLLGGFLVPLPGSDTAKKSRNSNSRRERRVERENSSGSEGNS